jgi:cyclase
MISLAKRHCRTPLIASGGAGSLKDFESAIEAGADALLAASIFHFGLFRIGAVKEHLRNRGYSIR